MATSEQWVMTIESVKIACFLLFLYAGIAAAIDVPLPSDVSFRMTASPSRGIAAGNTTELTLSVTNNGPMPLKTVPTLSSNFYDQFDQASSQSDCFIVLNVADDGTPFSYYYIWYPTDESEMAAGETRVCHIKLALTPSAPFVTEFSFGLPDFYVDSNSANERQAVFQQKTIGSVPTLAPSVVVMLFALIAAMGMGLSCTRVSKESLMGWHAARKMWVCLVLALVGTRAHAAVDLSSFSTDAPAPASNELFLFVGAQGTPAPPYDIGASKVWPVKINLAYLASLPPDVVVNFPDRAFAHLHLTHAEDRGPGAFLWVGEGNGCSGLFSAIPNSFRAILACGNGPYDVDKVPNGEDLQLTWYDQSLAPPVDDGPANLGVQSIPLMSAKTLVILASALAAMAMTALRRYALTAPPPSPSSAHSSPCPGTHPGHAARCRCPA